MTQTQVDQWLPGVESGVEISYKESFGGDGYILKPGCGDGCINL